MGGHDEDRRRIVAGSGTELQMPLMKFRTISLPKRTGRGEGVVVDTEAARDASSRNFLFVILEGDVKRGSVAPNRIE